MHWFALGALAMLALALAGCGGDGDDAEPSPATSTVATASPVVVDLRTPVAAEALVAGLRALRYPKELADGIYLGRANAPVTIIMFEDFTCPHCLSFTARLEQQLIDEFVAAGKVRLEFQNFPLRQSSLPIANAALCAAAQNGFWEYHSRLFLIQAGALEGAQFDAAGAKNAAAGVVPDQAAFDRCNDEAGQSQAVLAQARRAQSLGLTGTPAFLVNGKPVTGTPATLDAWRKLIDEAR